MSASRLSVREGTPLYGALLPLAGDALLVPNLALATAVTGDRPLGASASELLLGTLDWHGMDIPVVSFERLNGQRTPDVHGRHERFVVIHAFGSRLPGRAWALRATSYPRVVPLTAEVLQPAALRATDRRDLVLARTRIGEREIAIPDLEYIESLLAPA